MKVVLCAIVKMEGRYLQEFCDHYINKLKFDEIVLYDNNAYGTPMSDLEIEDETTMESLKSNSQIKIIPWRNLKCQQLKVYDLEIKKLKAEANTWCAFFDIDEFLLLKKHKCIQDFIQDYAGGQVGGITINWYMFGTNGHETYEKGNVTERFTTRMPTINKHVKSIVQPSKVLRMPNPHYATFMKGFFAIDTRKQKIPGYFNTKGSADIAIIHHYWTKSKQEFIQKRNRGRAYVNGYRSLSEIKNVELATVLDTSAKNPVIISSI